MVKHSLGLAVALLSVVALAVVVTFGSSPRAEGAAEATITLPLPLPTLFPPKPTSATPPTSATRPSVPPPTPTPPKPVNGLPVASGPTDTRPSGHVFTLTASSLTLTGTRYRGVVDQSIQLTVDAMTVGDLVQRGDLANGKVLTTRAGGVSTFTRGPIEVFVEELTGTLNAVGLPTVPITLSARSVLTPDVDVGFLALPQLTFTDVTARIVLIRGGDLHIPGAHFTLD